jgi:uncharacterized protein
MLRLFVDGDACPVKEEAYRVAARHGMPTILVTCLAMRDPARPGVSLVVVREGPDRADDYIAENIAAGDICVTDDIPLASRCIRQGALVVTARGRQLDEANIGEAVATRDLLESLRGDGTLREGGRSGGPPPFTKRDRARFLEKLEHSIRTILKTANE